MYATLKSLIYERKCTGLLLNGRCAIHVVRIKCPRRRSDMFWRGRRYEPLRRRGRNYVNWSCLLHFWLLLPVPLVRWVGVSPMPCTALRAMGFRWVNVEWLSGIFRRVAIWIGILPVIRGWPSSMPLIWRRSTSVLIIGRRCTRSIFAVVVIRQSGTWVGNVPARGLRLSTARRSISTSALSEKIDGGMVCVWVPSRRCLAVFGTTLFTRYVVGGYTRGHPWQIIKILEELTNPNEAWI